MRCFEHKGRVVTSGTTRMREPARQFPRRFSGRFQVPSNTLRTRAAGNGVGDQFRPRDEVAALWSILAGRDHLRLCERSDQLNQAFAALHAHGLKIFGFFCHVESLGGLFPAPPYGREARLLCIIWGVTRASHNSRGDAYVKREREIEARKILLGIEIGRRGYNPIAVFVGVNIPTIVVTAYNVLGFYFLRVEHFFARLDLDVIGYGTSARQIGQRETGKDGLHGVRRNSMLAVRRLTTLLCAQTGLFAAALKCEAVLDVGHIGHFFKFLYGFSRSNFSISARMWL